MTTRTRQRGPGRPPGARVEPEQRREELLDAAERSLRARGPELSLVDVAREAGLTRSAVYAAFPDKEAVTDALARRHTRRIVEELSIVVASTTSPREQTRAAVDCLCRWVDEEPHLSSALNPTMRGPAVFEELGQWFETVFAAGFEQLGGDVRAAGPWARAVLGAVTSSVQWWARERTMSREELVDHVSALLWSGFEGGGGAGLAEPINVSVPPEG